VLLTNADGTARAPELGAARLWVEAEGYVGGLHSVAAESLTARVELAAAGAIVVQVRDERGKAVGGAGILLLPPGSPENEGSSAVRAAPLGDVVKVTTALEAALRRLRSEDGDEADYAQAFEDVERSRRDLEHLLAAGGGARDGRGRYLPCRLLVSSPEGIAAWRAVPEGAGYRLAAPLEPVVEFTPASTDQRYTPVKGGFHDSGRDPARESGGVDVERGQAAECQVIVYRHTVVRGRLVGERGAANVAGRFNLNRRASFAHPTDVKSSLSALVENRAGLTSPGGEFEIVGLRPGDYELTGSARDPAGGQFSHFAKFELEAGQHLDLGDVRPLEGFELVVTPRLLTSAGEAVAASDVFERPSECLVTLQYECAFDPRTMPLPILDVVEVSLGSPVTVKGLPAGDVMLLTSVSRLGRSHEPLALKEGWILPATAEPAVRVRVPDAGHVDAPVLVERGVACTLEAIVKEDSGATELVCVVVNEATRAGGRHVLRRTSSAGVLSARLALPAGRYEAVCTSSQPDGSPPGGERVNLFGRERFTVERGSAPTVKIPMAPGVKITGTVVSKDGERGLVLASPDWLDPRTAGGWILSSRPGADGRFEITGAPPGARVKFSGSSQVVATGAPASEVRVDLRRDGR
jgi:hypothetical protein